MSLLCVLEDTFCPDIYDMGQHQKALYQLVLDIGLACLSRESLEVLLDTWMDIVQYLCK